MAVSLSPPQPPIHFSLLRLNNLSVRLVQIFRSLVAFPPESPIDDGHRKRELLDRYGLNPDKFLSEPSPMTRRRKQVPPDERKAPMETHKFLQVLGGKARRKELVSPKGMDICPMIEVVKGAAFDILQVAGGCPASLRPGRRFDLYSGTGFVSIEAISRGCSEIDDQWFDRTHLAIYGAPSGH